MVPSFPETTTTRPSPTQGGLRRLDGGDRAGILKRFQAVNRQRIEQLLGSLNTRQQLFIDVLPLLFHINHPLLPGFASKDTPAGVCHYTPSKATLAQAATLARSLDYRKQVPRSHVIEGLFLMGSTGTVAYTRRSDFDIWVCHEQTLSQAALSRLQVKVDRISRWAEGLGLEVYFFLMTAEDVRSGRMASLSSESSGSAQHHLLLDEFYRTSLLIAGRFPLWWLVPPEQDPAYKTYTEGLFNKRFIKPGDFIDFGGLEAVPANEFFGASLWQLFKAIDKPYKSLLKILLLESYASEHPKMELLSHVYKQQVFSGHSAPQDVDPYLLLFKKVQIYLEELRDGDRLTLARHSFYFRVRHVLDAGLQGRAFDWQRRHLLELIHSWGWSTEELARLDNHDTWELEQVLEERALLIRALTRSYRFLSMFARQQGELHAISQSDMTILGRRLFAAFERKAGKVDLFNTPTGRYLLEDRMLVYPPSAPKNDAWLLYRGTMADRPALEKTPPIKRFHAFMELLAWGYFNGVISRATSISFQNDNGVLRHESPALLRALEGRHPVRDRLAPDVRDLSRPSAPLQGTLFINVGLNPFEKFTSRGEHLTSNHFDPLNFAAQQENLVLSIDYLYLTTWKEVFIFHYPGLEGLFQCLEDFLRTASQRRPEIASYCFTPDRGHGIAQRVQQLFSNVRRAFAGKDAKERLRYIIKASNRYFSIRFEDGVPRHSAIGNLQDLYRYLGLASTTYVQTRFDAFALSHSPLPVMFKNHTPGNVHLYYSTQGADADLHVIDENGSLFKTRVRLYSHATLVNQYHRFFESIGYRQMMGVGEPLGTRGAQTPPRVEFFHLKAGANDSRHVERVQVSHDWEAAAYLDLHVIAQPVNDNTEYTVFCNGREFSTLEYGDQVFRAVARHVVTLRRSRAAYPIYITDIDLSALKVEEPSADHQQTLYYLHYKRVIEDKLNNALDAL